MPTLTQSQFNNLLADLPIGAKIELTKSSPGQLIVTVEKTKMDILNERYSGLINQEITVSDAAKKYNIVRPNIVRWKNKGYIAVINPGYPMTLNEADVAYCVDTYRDQKAKGIAYGTPLFDDDGLPYELKHPQLSKNRRKKN